MTETVRIAMWSGPRNISTAMMRAWENRADCSVIDEPFYGAYLAETGLRHPMRDEIMSTMPCEWSEVAGICGRDRSAPVIFQKHMCQHMVPAAPREWMAACRHAFLIRPPAEVAASFSLKYPGLTADDLGFRLQADLFNQVTVTSGTPPPVVEASDVLANPRGMLAALCDRLRVGFDVAMLNWPAGPRETDGVWAAHWYGAVEQSTSFAEPRSPTPPDPTLAPVIAACEPYYEAMRAHRIVV
ncbi:MAG: HAD family hydrolase [Pseudomonadota bacterium]